MTEAAKEFEINEINKTQVKFDIDKLKWLNGEYIRQKDIKEVYPYIADELKKNNINTNSVDKDRLDKIIELYRVRIKMFSEFLELTDFFFTDNYSIDEKGQRKYLDKEENKNNLKLVLDELKKIDDFSHAKLEEIYRLLAEKNDLKAANIIHPTRMAISGKTKGAGLFEIMELLGKNTVLERIEKAIK
jgi:glutamyl-tRNA synthetase